MGNCPFSKQPCLFPKVVHVTELKDGAVYEMHFCQKCAADYMQQPEPLQQPVSPELSGLPVQGPNVAASMLSLLKFLLNPSSIQVQPKIPQYEPCTNCGITLQEISKTGRLGCPHCYEHFGQILANVLQQAHGSLRHVGKVPKNFHAQAEEKRRQQEEAASIEDQIRLLRLKMAKAVEVENYEVAGVLKQKIEELQKQLTGASEPKSPSSSDQ